MYPFFLKGKWILINIYERGKKNKIKQSFKKKGTNEPESDLTKCQSPEDTLVDQVRGMQISTGL